MTDNHVDERLTPYCHGEMSAEESRRVAEHLLQCVDCKRRHQQIKQVVSLMEGQFPIPAPASIRGEVNRLVLAEPVSDSQPVSRWRVSSFQFAAASIAALLILVFGAIWYFGHGPGDSWRVASLAGAPTAGSDRIGAQSRLKVGEWLVTDGSSKAEISVADIGTVEVDPNTRIRIMTTGSNEHRLALAKGRISAVISAPPRLFFVNTPSAVAVDYGCAYVLEVDDAGRSLLHVTLGWVALELNGRAAMVPAGFLCETRPGTGPGTPFSEQAPAQFRDLLSRFDFEPGSANALVDLLAQAREQDSLTLWFLLSRVGQSDRERVYRRMVELAPPPPGVTRDGILQLDQRMLEQWKNSLFE